MTLARRPNNSLTTKPDQNLAIRQARSGESDFVPHLRIDEVQQLAREAESGARRGKGERDSLLIQTIFEGCFRVSEAVSLTPQTLTQTPHGWVSRIKGKGNKFAEVAISPSLSARLQSFAYRQGIKPDQKIFPVSTTRVWQIVDRAFEASGIPKPEHEGTVRVLRHLGAIARLATTGNPKAVQDQLRHKEARMTLRYLKTLSVKSPSNSTKASTSGGEFSTGTRNIHARKPFSRNHVV
jgi:integrase